MKYSHEDLGPMRFEDGDWAAEDVSVPFVANRISVCLANGSVDGPSQEALAGYRWIHGHWQSVLSILQEQAFEFYMPYADAFGSVPDFEASSDLLGTERLKHLLIFGKDQFEVTLRFDWQEPDDSHAVTFFVEDGSCNSHSVDG